MGMYGSNDRMATPHDHGCVVMASRQKIAALKEGLRVRKGLADRERLRRELASEEEALRRALESADEHGRIWRT